jgi:hypothetical protein
MSTAHNSRQVQLQKNMDMDNAKLDIKLPKNFLNANSATWPSQQLVNNSSTTRKKPNLIPSNYRQSFFTILSNQEKWNLVFEKLIDAFDRSEAAAQMKRQK